MNLETRMCCVEVTRKRYKSADQEQKSIILDEFCHTWRYNRKYAIRTLTALSKYSDNRMVEGLTPIKVNPRRCYGW